MRAKPQRQAAKRRGRGEDSIYFDQAKGRYVGAISLGFSPDGTRRTRRKVTGKTKAEVRDKLKELHAELDAGVRSSATYTVNRVVDDWLAEALDGRSGRTVQLYRDVLKPVTAVIGTIPLRDFTAHDVRRALTELAATHSTRTVAIAHGALRRAIAHAEANDHVRRNVAALIRPPKGQEGRVSKALTAEQAMALLKAAEDSRLHAYIVISLLTGIRTEEARALRWDHIDLDAGTVAVWRSVRYGGDTKTGRSRRTLTLPQIAVDALREHRKHQNASHLAAGPIWQDHGLVFTSTVGTPLDASHVRRDFKTICETAGIGRDWTPRELRHSFVSMLSASGVAVEEIARLAGHSSSQTTEVVYRKELRPALTRGAEVMDKIFSGD